ncbi:MAG: hypothetical protein QW757_01095 [Candidatus Woesearchaeota archaeon]
MVFSLFNYVTELFKIWLHTLFLVPFENYDMLWLLIPIWVAWFFAEFFQEKIGTSMGNAITNAVVILWGSIDCARQTVNLIIEKTIKNAFDIIARFGLIFILFLYGALIIHYGIKGNPIIKKWGKVRNITYVFAMFVPIFYNAIPFSFNHILAAILFFPLFYYTIELIDKYMPNPKAIEEDLNDIKKELNKTNHIDKKIEDLKKNINNYKTNNNLKMSNTDKSNIYYHNLQHNYNNNSHYYNLSSSHQNHTSFHNNNNNNKDFNFGNKRS